MDIQKKLQLGEKKFEEAVNVDYYQQLTLNNEKKPIIEYDIKNVLDVSDVFNNERQQTEDYRIYGRIEYLSLLNGLKNNYIDLADFFNPTTSNSKNILNSFDWYLLKPSTGYTSLGNERYIRNFEVITKLSDFDIYKSGYFVNIYKEQQYLFNFKTDFNVDGLLDALHFPITDLYLHPVYKKSASPVEILQRTTFPSGSKTTLTYPPTYNVGTIIYGDLIEYNSEEYSYEVISAQTYYITCPYVDSGSKELVFKYNPFIKIPLKVLSSEVEQVNISGTSYEDKSQIPYYAIPSENNDGNYIWREILPKGFFDPIDGQGVNFPFVNQKHYVFNNYLLAVIPDLTHPNTNTVFTNIKYGNNQLLYNNVDSLNNLGKLC
jgi:hypothetical protein